MKQLPLLTRSVTQVTPKHIAEQKLASGTPLKIYFGVDPTGSRLHLGHSVPLRKLQQFVEAGHHVTFLIGSFTAMIGDPTGKDEQRNMLDFAQIEQNFATYKEQASLIVDFSKVNVVYNHDWLSKLTFADVVQLASNFTVQQMLERDMFAKRFESGKPIYLHEFFYPLMQGYDSVALDVDGEIGGNDQYFNMLAGRTLQQSYNNKEKFVLTTPLILGTDGRKMSKSYNNCVYITETANEMYGQILSCKDDVIVEYFIHCTDVPEEEIQEMEIAMKNGANPKDYKMHLARTIVGMYHSEEAALAAEQAFESTFKNKEVPKDIVKTTILDDETLIDALVRSKICGSKSDARRIIEQGGVKHNDTVITDVKSQAVPGVYKVGKRHFIELL
jgi:tyrosyl-tRNA synthetase